MRSTLLLLSCGLLASPALAEAPTDQELTVSQGATPPANQATAEDSSPNPTTPMSPTGTPQSNATDANTKDARADAKAAPDASAKQAENAPTKFDAPRERTEQQLKEDRALYELGNGAYVRGDYEEAIRHFSELHRRTEHPALLFNMAQAHRLAGPEHCLEARRLYESYVHEDPNVPNGSEVRERIEQLRPCAEKQEADLSNKVLNQEPALQLQRPVPTFAKVLTISGGVLLAAGGGLFTASRIRFAQVKDDCPCEPGAFSSWDGLQSASYIMMGLGATSLIAGGSWWWSASSTPPLLDTGRLKGNTKQHMTFSGRNLRVGFQGTF